MPCRFRYQTRCRVLVQHFLGVLDLPEVLAHYDRVLGHPALPDTRLELTDMRCIGSFGFDSRALSGLVAMLSAEYLRRKDTFERGAVIVGAGPGEFAARLFLDALPAMVQPHYGIFRDSTAALAWLDLGAAHRDAPARTDHAPHAGPHPHL